MFKGIDAWSLLLAGFILVALLVLLGSIISFLRRPQTDEDNSGIATDNEIVDAVGFSGMGKMGALAGYVAGHETDEIQRNRAQDSDKQSG